MRGPPMPANIIERRRAFSAAMRCPASRSPEASPATMPTRRSSAIYRMMPRELLARNSVSSPSSGQAAAGARLRLVLAPRILEREAAAVERAIGALDRLDGLRSESAPPQTLAVDAVGARHAGPPPAPERG